MRKLIIIQIFLLLALQVYTQSIPTQRNTYSKKPLEVMGFTAVSTFSQVKKQLNSWELQWDEVSLKKENSYGEQYKIKIDDVKYQGVQFSSIDFGFDSNGRIKSISFASYDDEDAVHNVIKILCKDFPFRGYYKYGYLETEVYNGKDDSEFAYFPLAGFGFSFWFNTNIYDYFSNALNH